MKITYQEWKCFGCTKVVRFTDQNVFSAMPYWFTLRTEGRVSSSERPSFNTSVCSIDCLGKAGIVIGDFIENRSYSIPRKKHIDATICDQCGKVAKVDRLNMIFGPSPLEDWVWEKNSEGRKDFCSGKCKKNHCTEPENSVFVNFKFDDIFATNRLIEAIDDSDFVERIRKPSKGPFLFPPTISQDIARINEENKKS